MSQLEHAFVSSSTFTLQKLWFYVHPTLHTLSIVYTLTTELNDIENPPKEDDDSSSEEDPEAMERKRALGLGDLKAVIKDLLAPSTGLVKGGEVVAILWERMRNNSGYVGSIRLTFCESKLDPMDFGQRSDGVRSISKLVTQRITPLLSDVEMVDRNWTSEGPL